MSKLRNIIRQAEKRKTLAWYPDAGSCVEYCHLSAANLKSSAGYAQRGVREVCAFSHAALQAG
jgi:hypothetical protein